MEPGNFFQRLTGGVKTGIILKDVSMLTHSGEVTAILGSKGMPINIKTLIHKLCD